MLSVHYRVITLIPVIAGLAYFGLNSQISITNILLIALSASMVLEAGLCCIKKDSSSIGFTHTLFLLFVGLAFLSNDPLYLFLLIPALIYLEKENLNLKLILASLLLISPLIIFKSIGTSYLHWLVVLVISLLSIFLIRPVLKKDGAIDQVKIFICTALSLYLINYTWSEDLLLLLAGASVAFYVVSKSSLFFMMPLSYSLSVLQPEVSLAIPLFVVAGVLNRISRLFCLLLASGLFLCEELFIHAGVSLSFFILSLFSDRSEKWEEAMTGISLVVLFGVFHTFMAIDGFDLRKDYIVFAPSVLLLAIIFNHKLPAISIFTKVDNEDSREEGLAVPMWDAGLKLSTIKGLSNRIGLTGEYLMIASVVAALGAILLWY